MTCDKCGEEVEEDGTESHHDDICTALECTGCGRRVKEASSLVNGMCGWCNAQPKDHPVNA